MRLFGECTQKHGMFAVVWNCRAENIAMNECMKEECVFRGYAANSRMLRQNAARAVTAQNR